MNVFSTWYQEVDVIADLDDVGELAVTVRVKMLPAEPENGINNAYVDDWTIIAVEGTPVKNPEELYRRISSTPMEEDHFMDRINEALSTDDQHNCEGC